MTDVLHVKAYRLFDRSKAEAEGKDFPLLVWEEEHLRECEECHELSAVFNRFCKETPRLFANGERNATSGWYKNLCCGIEDFVIAGKHFPECRRHKNLPTSWKLIKEEDDRTGRKSA
jgi:hypothetical protein